MSEVSPLYPRSRRIAALPGTVAKGRFCCETLCCAANAQYRHRHRLLHSQAFAEVHREDFLGPGPWVIPRWFGEYVPTPSADPVYL